MKRQRYELHSKSFLSNFWGAVQFGQSLFRLFCEFREDGAFEFIVVTQVGTALCPTLFVDEDIERYAVDVELFADSCNLVGCHMIVDATDIVNHIEI